MKSYPIFLIFCGVCVSVILQATCNVAADGDFAEEYGFVVKRKDMKALVSTENGEILAARVGAGNGNAYLLHFFAMDPNSLFLPVILHSDMVFYVNTGSGKLSWTEENEVKTTDLRRGDVYRLKEGAAFFIQSNLETDTERRRLRINAIFSGSNIHHLHLPTATGPYSSIRDMVLGFDKKVLQSAFKVGEEEIEELLNAGDPPAIIHGVSKSGRRVWEMETKFLGRLLGSGSNYNIFELNKKMGKGKGLFNLFKESKDFENGNGWSTAVTGKKLSALKDTNIGLFMVNLTTGSMMGPHWNPVATEIGVVLQGRGMVHVACSCSNETAGCRSMRFEVEEGDVFAVPRFHPMAQMAFNNGTFVFMGFSDSARKNHPQYLAGQASVLRTLSKDVLAIAFNVRNSTMDQLLVSQQDSVILGCTSCAEEELRILQEEREKEKEEAREEEERRRKEEEEAREREEEEEEEAKRQEEERKRREEEAEEEAAAKRKKEEEEAREREEEEAKRHEEEEEEARRQEEEREKREKEAEEEAKRQEEERKRREEEEEEEAKRQEEEEEAAKRKEKERKRQEEKEEAREREEEEAERQEQERKRREKEAAAAAKREEEEEAARREEEERERREEAAERRRAEEERRRRQEEKEARREEEERKRRREEEEEEEEEGEMARREEEERQKREEEEEGRERGRERKEEKGRRSEEEEAEEEERRREKEWEREEEEERRQRRQEEQ